MCCKNKLSYKRSELFLSTAKILTGVIMSSGLPPRNSSLRPFVPAPDYKYGKTQNIQRGDLILQEDVWLWTFLPTEEGVQQVCNRCFQVPQGVINRSHRCPQCRIACYCSSACQQTDWKLRHQFECESLLHVQQQQRNRDNANNGRSGSSGATTSNTNNNNNRGATVAENKKTPSTSLSVLLGMAATVLANAQQVQQQDAAHEIDETSGAARASALALLQAYENVPLPPQDVMDDDDDDDDEEDEEADQETADAGEAGRSVSTTATTTDQFFANLIGKFDSNENNLQRRLQLALVVLHRWPADGVKEPHAYSCIALGICLQMSRFPHACAPNAVAIDDGRTVRCIALADIASINDVRLQRLTWSDIISMPRTVRRQNIRALFGYRCRCERCDSGRPTDDQDPIPIFQIRCPHGAAFVSCPGTCHLNFYYLNIKSSNGHVLRQWAQNIVRQYNTTCSTCGAKYTSVETVQQILWCLHEIWCRLDYVPLLANVSEVELQTVFDLANKHLQPTSVSYQHFMDKWLMHRALKIINQQQPQQQQQQQAAPASEFLSSTPRLLAWSAQLYNRMCQHLVVLEQHAARRRIIVVGTGENNATNTPTGSTGTNGGGGSSEGSSTTSSSFSGGGGILPPPLPSSLPPTVRLLSASTDNFSGSPVIASLPAINSSAGITPPFYVTYTLKQMLDLLLDIPYFIAASHRVYKVLVESAAAAAAQAAPPVEENNTDNEIIGVAATRDICTRTYDACKRVLRSVLHAERQMKPFDEVDRMLPVLLTELQLQQQRQHGGLLLLPPRLLNPERPQSR